MSNNYTSSSLHTCSVVRFQLTFKAAITITTINIRSGTSDHFIVTDSKTMNKKC